jgi:NAD(P)H-hydrate epimerase
MKVVTAEQMRRIDRITIEERGIPGCRLMERAGQAVVEQVCERFEPDGVAVVAGKGNNAGDGFVVARLLAQRQAPVTVFLLADPAEFRSDARTMYEAIPATVKQVRIENSAQLRDTLKEFDLVVDAILGTGIQGPVRGLFGEAIEAINDARLPVVSVDIPSGLPTDGGPIEGPVVRAAHTVTMGLPKLGMVIQPGIEFTGTVTVASLDFPEDLLNDPQISLNLLPETMVRDLLPPRPRDGHKGTFGSVMIVGGSQGMTGAPALASRAAMRSGVGLVFCASADGLQPQIAARLVEELTIPLPSSDGHALDLSSLPKVAAEAKRMKAIALGPGVGQAEGTQQFVRKTAAEIQLPMVIDADALNALAGHLDILRTRRAGTILTPHPGEMSRLTGLTTAQVQADRIGVARKLATDYGVVVVLKGAQTIIADPDGSAYINPTGNSGLAKGGSGDVLTGLIAGLLAQNSQALPAALCGVFLHGLAADLAADSVPPRAMIASDVIEYLPKAFRVVLKV